MKPVVLILATAALLLSAACTGDRDGEAADRRIVVVTTFSLLEDLTTRIGGDRVEVVNLIPLGVDEHAYHPSTSVPRDVVRADLAIVNGYFLEETLLAIVVENVRPGVPVVAAARGLDPVEGTHVHVYQEGDADQALVDAAVRRIDQVSRDAHDGTRDVDEAIAEIDVIVHDLPSRARTEVIRAIDRFIHDVPRGRVTAEEAIAGILAITGDYAPPPGPEAVLAAIEQLLHDVEDGALAATEALDASDRLLDGLALDQRDDSVGAVEVMLAEWRAGRLDAAVAVAQIDAALHGEVSFAATPDAIDDVVFAEGDPHFWLDARNMAVYAANIRDALIRVDPEGADGYRERAAVVIAELQALHEEVTTALAFVPAERRKIVVFHDAFRYFAAAYDFEVVAAVAPANPNQATSAAAIAEIIRVVREAGVSTIYREPQFAGQALDLIARDSGAEVGVLYSIPTEVVPTYAEMMRANARALVEGLAR